MPRLDESMIDEELLKKIEPRSEPLILTFPNIGEEFQSVSVKELVELARYGLWVRRYREVILMGLDVIEHDEMVGSEDIVAARLAREALPF